MNWKKILRTLERTKQWDEAIKFMQEVIEKNLNDMDAYIAMNFLIMNLLADEPYYLDDNQHRYYAALAQKYFEESYEKFSDNAEYLYYTGRIAVMGEWYFGIETDDYIAMMAKAAALDPHNPIYQWNFYAKLARKNIEDEGVVAYANKILDENSPIKKILSSKGALGEDIFDMMTTWAKKIIAKDPYLYS